VAPGPPPANINEAASAQPPGREQQSDLREEVSHLRSEVERLLEQQQALQRTPRSNDAGTFNDAEDEENEANPRCPDRVRRARRPSAETNTCAVGCRAPVRGRAALLELPQSYEWTDDAEIDGHRDAFAAARVAADRRSRVSHPATQEAARKYEHRLHRNRLPRALPWRFAGRARQGPGGRTTGFIRQ
jgi:hypothetical protein